MASNYRSKPGRSFAIRRFIFDTARLVSNAIFGPNLTQRSKAANRLLAIIGLILDLVSPVHRKQRAFQAANPDAPWIVPESIPAIEGLMRPEFTVFEWGAGNSTIWLARRVGRVISVEGRRQWFEYVTSKLQEHGLDGKVELILIEVPEEPTPPTRVVKAYTNKINMFDNLSLDIVFIDGHFRADCLRRGIPKIKPGGYLIVDNADDPRVAPHLSQMTKYLLHSFSNDIWFTNVYRAPIPHGFSR